MSPLIALPSARTASPYVHFDRLCVQYQQNAGYRHLGSVPSLKEVIAGANRALDL